MKRLSKRAQGLQATTAPQAIEGLKTQFQTTMTELNNMMQQLQGSVGKMNDMMRAVEQLETQVGQLEQMRMQTQQATQQQTQQGVQQAEDGAIDWRTLLGKGWAKIVDLVGPDAPYEVETENAVAGVRGSDKKKPKRPKHLSPRDKEHNKDLPDFWRKNLDYGESPYMHIDKLEKITDDVSLPRRKKTKK